MRTNGIPERAKVWAAKQSPEFSPLLHAFVAGLNAWGTEHADSLSAPAKAVTAEILPALKPDIAAHLLAPAISTDEQYQLEQCRQEIAALAQRVLFLERGSSDGG